MAVVLSHPKHTGKTYRLPTERDLNAYRAAKSALEQKRQALWAEWGMDPVPDEEIQMTGRGQITTPLFGMTRFGDMFNARQKLTLITFVEKVRQVFQHVSVSHTQEFARAIVTYLALAVDRLADSDSMQCWWQSTWEKEAITFARQALQMTWDYFESNPLGEKGYRFDTFVGASQEVIKRLAGDGFAIVNQGTAVDLPWPEDTFDAVLTDPPYYDNVNYSALSNFFYVWLRRTLADHYPDLFTTPLAPKLQEIVQDPNRHESKKQAQAFFEEMLTRALGEIHRVLKPQGIAVIVFAHKTTEAWETIINALLDAGLYMTASWPIHTEMQSRLNANETAALASSIYMVCRKRTTNQVGEYPKVRKEIDERVRQKLTQFWDEGIRGADFFMSAIGPAVEAFGKYARVEKLSVPRWKRSASTRAWKNFRVSQ